MVISLVARHSPQWAFRGMWRDKRRAVALGVVLSISGTALEPLAGADEPSIAPPLPIITEEKLATPFPLYPAIATHFPFWMGFSADLSLNHRFVFGLGYGYIPVAFAAEIGNVAGKLSGNPALDRAIRDQLAHNSAWHLKGEYFFYPHPNFNLTGWSAGMHLYYYTTRGDSSIDTVEAATGVNFSTLKLLLALLNLDLRVAANGQLFTGGFFGGYSWRFGKSVGLQLSGGVAKIFVANARLSSNSADFNNGNAGRQLFNAAQSELENVLLSYGVSPFLGLQIRYYF